MNDVNNSQEAQWLQSSDPIKMLASMPVVISDRKMRLFSCACCRHFLTSLSSDPYKTAVETAEKFADGQTTKAALKRARQGVRGVRHQLPPNSTGDHAEWASLWMSEVAASENAFDGVIHEIERFTAQNLLKPDQCPPAASYLRCVAGNSFRQERLDSKWITSEAVALARSIYDNVIFDQMPELGFALQHAGCTDYAILNHCSSTGPHVRGCWVVDEIPGKS